MFTSWEEFLQKKFYKSKNLFWACTQGFGLENTFTKAGSLGDLDFFSFFFFGPKTSK